MKVGFIGLGNMGQPMAEALVGAGVKLIGFDIASCDSATITMAASAQEAVLGADIVILMLNSGEVVSKVLDDILPHLAAGCHILDCSTIDMGSVARHQAACMAQDIIYMDAPVSGGIAAAAAGSLTFMVGGPETGLHCVKPLLEVMGGKIVHCGPCGTGSAAKICNNMILGITMLGTCEAFALADQLGLERSTLYDVVSGASGQSWSMTSYCPAPHVGPTSPADNDYKPGFSADLMLKDLRLAQMASDEAGVETQMGALAAELYRAFVQDGDGSGQDFSAVLKQMSPSH